MVGPTQHFVFRLCHFNVAKFLAEYFWNCLNNHCASFREKKTMKLYSQFPNLRQISLKNSFGKVVFQIFGHVTFSGVKTTVIEIVKYVHQGFPFCWLRYERNYWQYMMKLNKVLFVWQKIKDNFSQITSYLWKWHNNKSQAKQL